MPNLSFSIDITRIKNNRVFPMSDDIVDEPVLALYVNGNPAFEMVFSPRDTPYLAAGFLFTQSIVKNKKEIENIRFDPENNRCHVDLLPKAYERYLLFKQSRQIKGSSGGAMLQGNSILGSLSCDKGPQLSSAQVLNLIHAHFDHSKLFKKTGAVHSAGLCSKEKLLYYLEDIGRHNALDKLAGLILMKEIDTTDLIATVSCRMSLEIIGKIIRAHIPVVISNTAPTLSAVKLAKKSGLTMIGFARDNRFNIYSHEHRIRRDVESTTASKAGGVTYPP